MTIKNITDFVSPSTIRPELHGVLVTPEKIVATDAFKLIEEKSETGVKAPVIVVLPKGVKTFEKVRDDGAAVIGKKGETYLVETLEANRFPEYEQLFRQDEPIASITLDVKHLKAVCEAFLPDKRVTVCVRGANQFIEFSQGNKRALLAPVIKS